MARARKHQIHLSECRYYHCISRCVRRSYLCGQDKLTGKSYDHRKDWIEEKLCFLAQVFAIDLCAYAVMSNHFHVVLHVDVEQAKLWEIDEVIQRWHKLFKGTLLTQQYINNEDLEEYQLQTVLETAEVYRKQLTDISWFMRIINESIAREANKEDDCKGRFWEGRFTSQALLDEKALASCMVYVDLNPIRAGVANSPETSQHTSIKKRIESLQQGTQPRDISPLKGAHNVTLTKAVDFDVYDYLELVEITGRCIREDKPGYIDEKLPSLLNRLNISSENWLKLSCSFRSLFTGPAGQEACLKQFCARSHIKRANGLTNSRQYLS